MRMVILLRQLIFPFLLVVKPYRRWNIIYKRQPTFF